MKNFTQTCDKPYDRHFYIVTYKDGRTYTYEDYEQVRYHYFQQADTTGSTVTVMDNNQYNATHLRTSRGQGF